MMLTAVSHIHSGGSRETRDMTAPMLPVSDKETSLNILTNALTSGTGSTAQQKNEKASYGAIAEALRDEPAVRYAKYEVNSRSIPKVESRIKRLRRTKKLYKIFEVVFGVATLLLGILTTSMAEIEEWKDKPFKGFASGLHVVNLLMGAILLYCAKGVGKIREEMRQLERDLEKKIMYNSVAGRTLGIQRQHVTMYEPANETMKTMPLYPTHYV
nr:NS3 [Sathuvachari virus]